jgi:hypothetical protein
MLPALGGGRWTHRNRFIGDHLVYTANRMNEKGYEASGAVGVTNLGTHRTDTFALPQPVSRIEALGDDALVVGSGKDLVFTSAELAVDRARLNDTYTVSGAADGEARSHGFFYRSDSEGGSSGVLGVSMVRPFRAGEASPFQEGALDMLFLRRRDRRLGALGELRSNPQPTNDNCVASCVDWYGNARPIFLRGRVFALLGYELVEGREAAGGITETARVNFAPKGRPLCRLER